MLIGADVMKTLLLTSLFVVCAVGCQRGPTEAELREKAFRNAAMILADSVERSVEWESKSPSISHCKSMSEKIKQASGTLPDARHNASLNAAFEAISDLPKQYDNRAELLEICGKYRSEGNAERLQECESASESGLNAISLSASVIRGICTTNK